jgi:hypothetical protein
LNEKNRDTREREREREREERDNTERVRLKDSSEMKKRVLIYILVKNCKSL